MSAILLPCPFCGSVTLRCHPDQLYGPRAFCNSCHAVGPSATTSERAARAWNRRASEARHLELRTAACRLVEEALALPLRWRKPRRVFVNSMSDLFHEKLADADIDRVFAVMALAPQHTFMVLTKRQERMHEYFSPDAPDYRRYRVRELVKAQGGKVQTAPFWITADLFKWPLPNVWLGVSVEDQATVDERIPVLLRTPAAKRFVSYEPALGPVEFAKWLMPRLLPHDVTGRATAAIFGVEHVRCIDLVIVGGESGPGARLCDVAWIRSVIAQCKAASVAVFCKQLGARPVETVTEMASGGECAPGRCCDERTYQLHFRDHKGGDMSEWPADLRVREMPT